MLKKNEFMILTVVSVLLAGMILASALLDRANRKLQAEVVQRQAYIQQSVQLEGLYVEMIKAVAELSERAQDPALRKVLTDQGMTVQTALQPQPQLLPETQSEGLPEELVIPGGQSNE